MADWSRDKVDASNLNNGQEYTLDSDVSLEQLNAVVNNSLYAGDFVEELTNIDTTNINNVGEARVRVESSPNATPTKPYKRLVFENLKGEQGESGADGKSAYKYAQDGGYTGTEQEFIDTLGNIGEVAPAEPTKLGTVFGNTEENPNGATTLGYNARSTSRYAVAIGAGSSVDAQGAIQIGAGSNTIPNSATFGSSNSPVNSLALYTTRNGVTGYHTVAFEEDLNNSGESGGTSAGLPIGIIIPAAIVQNDAGLHLLDGGEIVKGGVYDSFYNWVLNHLDRVPQTDIYNYNLDLIKTGSCGKFVINDTDVQYEEKGYVIGARTIKLPTIAYHIEGLSDISEIGTALAAGLPNITGSFRAYKYDTTYATGAFTEATSNEQGSSYGTSDTKYAQYDFDASNSSSIYKKDVTTVQTNTVKYPYYIVVGTTTKTDIEVNIDNVVTDLNNKADKSEIPVEVIDTIWTNSKPTSSQATQTITATEDLTQYKAFILTYNRATDNTTKYTMTQYKGSNSDLINTNFVGLWGYYSYQRNVNIKVASNQIEIGACYKQTSLGGGSTDNTKNILVSVRGVKDV